MHLWDASGWRPLSVLTPRFPPAQHLAVSSDGKMVLAEADSRARIYPWEMLAPLNELEEMARAPQAWVNSGREGSLSSMI